MLADIYHLLTLTIGEPVKEFTYTFTDKNGKVIAVSDKNNEYLIGKILTQEWVEKTLNLRDTSKYSVSKFEKSTLYDNESTYIYSSAIRSFKDDKIITGGIAVVFDSTPQFNSMLDECLPKNVDGVNIKGVFALFANKDKYLLKINVIISSKAS